jgi:uncharacterized phage protein (TIGR02218 family)
MPKSASAGLIAHLDQPRTNLATCWMLTRTDGTVFGFTDHDQPLAIDADGLGSVTYRPVNAFSRSAIGSDEKLEVDELEVVGVLDGADIAEADLRAGRYDDAEVRIFLVNWSDPSQGVLKLRRGWLGEVRLGDFGYTAELMGLTLAYQRNIVELVSPKCLAELGDGRCKVPPTRRARWCGRPPSTSAASSR